MPRFEPNGAGASPLWLDHTAYTAQLLASGHPPWLDAMACATWLKKGHGLLQPDVVRFPTMDLIAAWAEAHPELGAALGEKSRDTYPLKRLLADGPLRAHIAEVLQALRGGLPNAPIALALAMPSAMLTSAAALAGRALDTPDEDMVDTAAMYVADALRELSALAPDCIDIVLLEATGADVAGELDLCQPIFNVAEHQRWQVALRADAAESLACEAVDIVIAEAPGSGTRGVLISQEGWTADNPSSGGDFWFACVPAGSDPEQVLARVAGLKKAPTA